MGIVCVLSCLSSSGEAAQTVSSYVTFYGFDDNDDGNPSNTGTTVISHPSVHDEATEDLGTYSRPGTLAAAKGFLPPGTIVYVPALKRYYVMEDTCRECASNWKNDKIHVDLFVSGRGEALQACEYRLTMESTKIIIDPPADLPVRKGSACGNTTIASDAMPGGGSKNVCSASKTSNQCNVLNAASEASDGDDPLALALENLSAEELPAALAALSGEIYATTLTVLVNESRYVRDAVLSRLRQAYYTNDRGQVGSLGITGPTVAPSGLGPLSKGDALQPPPYDSSLTFWTSGFGSWASFDAQQGASSTESTLGGFVSGMDARVAGSWRLGLASGYSQSDFSVDALHSSGTAKTAHLGVYGGGDIGIFAVRGGGTYAWSAIDTNRSVVFPGFAEREEASYDVDVGQIFGEVAYPIAIDGVALEPFAGLAFVSAQSDGFREKGGIAALSSSGDAADVGYSTLGMRVAKTVTWSDIVVTPNFSAAWQHAFGDITPEASLLFITTGAPFDVAGVPIAEDSLLIEAGLDFAVSSTATAGVSYVGQFADGAQENALKGRVAWRF